MPPLSAISIYLFGLMAFIAGAHDLMFPSTSLSARGLSAEALPVHYGNALAAIAMGLYYTLAAYQRNRMFFILTVPMRLLTASVFGAQGGLWRGVAMWEAGGALITAFALFIELTW